MNEIYRQNQNNYLTKIMKQKDFIFPYISFLLPLFNKNTVYPFFERFCSTNE